MAIRNKIPELSPTPRPSSLELCSPTALHITHWAEAGSISRKTNEKIRIMWYLLITVEEEDNHQA